MKHAYPHITVTKGMAGYFAVMLWWNQEHGSGFAEPYSTGEGRYRLQADAIREAKQWAEADGLPFVEPKIETAPTRQDVEQQIREIIPDIQIIRVGK